LSGHEESGDLLPPIEHTPGGNDLGLLRESLALTPEQRIDRNVEWLRLVEELRAGRREAASGPEADLPSPR
jgi:hypothetical protein